MAGIGILLAGALLRIVIDAPGRYEVPAAAVKDAGLELAACDLYGGATAGVPDGRSPTGDAGVTAVPIAVHQDGGFEFLGAVHTRHSKKTVFELRPRGEGASPARAEAAALPTPDGYFRVEKNDVYDPMETGERPPLDPFGYGGCDYFYFGEPKQTQEWKLEFPRAASGPTPHFDALRIALQGERTTAASNGVDLTWNGQHLGKGAIRWAGPREHVEEIVLGGPKVKDGPNTLKIDTRDGRVRLDWVEWSGASPEIGHAKKPVSIEKVTPDDVLAGGADWLAIAVDSCADAVKPLADFRASQGMKARVVKLSDVFAEFSAGNFDPRAIRRFLAHAKKSWSPAPRYVLLVGGATYDVEGIRKNEVLPTALVDTFDNGASASDAWFVSFDDAAVTPEIALGRFPVSKPDAVQALVEKTIACETKAPTGPWRRRCSFVAGEGRFGEAIDNAIEALATDIFNEYIPQGFELDMTYASAASPYLWIPAKLTDKIVERMNEGAALVNYTGHGGRQGFDDLRFKGKRYSTFSSSDVPKVKCGDRHPIVLITACWTGCFDYPDETSVGERLFESPDGAAAVFAASRISHPYANAMLSKELVAALFHAEGDAPATSTGTSARQDARRLGDVILDAKRHMQQVGSDKFREQISGAALMFVGDPLLMVRLLRDDVHLYSLFGDPALALPFPRGEIALEAKGAAISGKKLAVHGTTGALKDGKVVVTFETERRELRSDIEPVDIEAPGAEKTIAKNYAKANDKVLARVETKVEGGAFDAVLELPDGMLFTKHYLKAYAWSASGDALGALEMTVTDEE